MSPLGYAWATVIGWLRKRFTGDEGNTRLRVAIGTGVLAGLLTAVEHGLSDRSLSSAAVTFVVNGPATFVAFYLFMPFALLWYIESAWNRLFRR